MTLVLIGLAVLFAAALVFGMALGKASANGDRNAARELERRRRDDELGDLFCDWPDSEVRHGGLH